MIILKSGKEVYANRDLVSINDDVYRENGPFLNEGYDGDISLLAYDDKTNAYQPDFTKEELIELAEMMIERWQRFIYNVNNGKVPTKVR